MFCRAVELQCFDGQLVKAYCLYSIHSTYYLTKERRGIIKIKSNRKKHIRNGRKADYVHNMDGKV